MMQKTTEIDRINKLLDTRDIEIYRIMAIATAKMINIELTCERLGESN